MTIIVLHALTDFIYHTAIAIHAEVIIIANIVKKITILQFIVQNVLMMLMYQKIGGMAKLFALYAQQTAHHAQEAENQIVHHAVVDFIFKEVNV